MNEFHALLTNACTLITLNYIALKLRNKIIIQSYEMIMAPVLTGAAAIVMMIQPYDVGFMTLDLRFVPIVMAGLRFGIVVALLSTLLPAGYAWYIHEPVYWGILQGLILPAIISSFFYKSEYRWGYFMLRYTDTLKMCALLFILQISSGYVMLLPQFNIWLLRNFFMLIISCGSIAVLVAMLNDENKSWLQQRELELKANQDGLTRLPNLRSFMDICKNTLCKRKAAILMIDIDNFKNYNDTLGHMQGDQLLREVGEVMQEQIGHKDYLARYGGEEFIILSYNTEKETLSRLAGQLCGAVSAYPFIGRECQPGAHISISIGVSAALKVNDDMNRLIAEADEALYESKRKGKNTYTFYNHCDQSLKQNA